MRSTSMARTAIIAIAMATFTLALSGCASTDPGAHTISASPAAQSPRSEPSAPEASEVPAPTEARSDPPPAGDLAPEVLNVRRGDYEHACTAAPLVIEGEQAEVRVSGPCTSVTVNARNTTIKIQETSALVVAGAQATVIVEHVGSITISGSKNTVKWRTGDPAVQDTGEHNKVIEMD